MPITLLRVGGVSLHRTDDGYAVECSNCPDYSWATWTAPDQRRLATAETWAHALSHSDTGTLRVFTAGYVCEMNADKISSALARGEELAPW